MIGGGAAARGGGAEADEHEDGKQDEAGDEVHALGSTGPT
jgi:hypothetical protein